MAIGLMCDLMCDLMCAPGAGSVDYEKLMDEM